MRRLSNGGKKAETLDAREEAFAGKLAADLAKHSRLDAGTGGDMLNRWRITGWQGAIRRVAGE